MRCAIDAHQRVTAHLAHNTASVPTDTGKLLMNEQTTTDQASSQPRSRLSRFLYMVLFMIVYSVSESIVFIVALVNLLFAVFSDGPHPSVTRFGRQLADYVQQVVRFLSFDSEELPFPFGKWPASDTAA